MGNDSVLSLIVACAPRWPWHLRKMISSKLSPFDVARNGAYWHPILIWHQARLSDCHQRRTATLRKTEVLPDETADRSYGSTHACIWYKGIIEFEKVS